MEIKKIIKTENDVSFVIEISKDKWQNAIKDAKKYIDEAKKDKNDSKCGCDSKECDVDNETNKKEIYNHALLVCEIELQQSLINSKEFKEIQDELLELPEINVENVDDNSCVVKIIFDIKPNIELPSFDDFKLEQIEEIVVDVKEIELEIQNIIDRSKKKVAVKSKTKKLANGDIANINFLGKVDGKEFDGGKADDYDLIIGSDSFIPGFEKQMIGMIAGETKDINVEFPKEYHSKELAGKKAIFEVKLNEIREEITPELDDKFVKELKIPEIDSIDKLKTYVHDFLKQQKEHAQESKLEKKVMDHLANSKISYQPKIMKNKFVEQIKEQQFSQLSQYGIDFDQYIKMIGKDKETIMYEIENEAIKQLTITIALAELIKAHHIEVSDEEFERKIEKIANIYNVDKEVVRKQVPSNAIKSTIRSKKIIKDIINKAQKK